MATTTATASWGVTGTAPVTGVMTDCEYGEESILGPEQNEVGSIINQTKYDIRKTANCTVQVAAGTAAPAAGTQVTIDGKTMYVTSARVVENNTSYRKIQISAEAYALCTATQAASGIGSSTPSQGS